MDSSNNNEIIEKRYKEYCDILSKHQSFVLSEKKKRKSQVLSQALGIDTEKELELGDVLRHRGETFQECLLRYSQRSGMTDAEIYNRAHITKQTFVLLFHLLFSPIFSLPTFPSMFLLPYLFLL